MGAGKLNTISDIRKAIKPLGFNIKTKQYSYGIHAAWFRLEDKRELPTIFTEATLAEWQPLLDWRKEHKEELTAIKNSGLIYGLI